MDKNFLASKTVWGVLIAALPTFGPRLGLNFSADDAQMVGEGVDAIVTGVGSLIAVWGRATASKSIKLF